MYKYIFYAVINKYKTISTLKTINYNINSLSKTNLILSPGYSQHRNGFACYSTNTLSKDEIVSYEAVKKAGETKNIFVIDVREPEELKETGVIPGSINIPLGDVENILKHMPDDEFSKKYGRHKPSKDSPVIFSCKMGKRSATAQEICKQLGFKNVKNYLGGWLDWHDKHLKK